MSIKKILVVDDELGIRELLRDILIDEGFEIFVAENATEARELKKNKIPDLILLDIWMPDCDGITLLKEWVNEKFMTSPVVMMSGHGTIDTALEATKIGAFDFLEKPITLQKLLKTVNEALKHANNLPKIEINLLNIGKSEVIQDLKKRLDKLISLKTPLLLVGPQGGCAKICAQYLHPKNQPWIDVKDFEVVSNAPADLLDQHRGGSIFLNEISHLTKSQQKGLNLLISKAANYDVRIICATSKSLTQENDVDFDERILNELLPGSLLLPSINEHKEDIPELASSILTMHLTKSDKSEYKVFDVAALNMMRGMNWLGDIEELESFVFNLMQTSLLEKISADDVKRVSNQFNLLHDKSKTSKKSKANKDEGLGGIFNKSLRDARDEFERMYFKHHLNQDDQSMSKLSEVSGVERTHLYRKLKQLGIKVK
ncbi:PspF Transcriptional regulators containing an AAA-type ATPase domain and a DNA-binding domain [Candidatus Methylopumilus planktonicus]|uniref:sigma-54-dependent transcriptional regulator n=1 Tax=Candidatus Methylopumilus planktonicus TaxID=1581557 RepID=UPI003BEEF365